MRILKGYQCRGTWLPLCLSLFLFKRGEDYDLQMGLLSVAHRKQAQDPSPPVANGTRLRGAAVVSQ